MAVAQLQDHSSHPLQPRPFELGGYLESKYTHYQLNRGSAFYAVEYAGQPQRATRDLATATLRLNGSVRAEAWQLRFHTRSTWEHDQFGEDAVNRFDELALAWKPRADFALDAGKIVLRWGKGHPWNPVAFVERPKDSTDPRLAREGYSLITARVNHEFSGFLQSLTFTPVLLPVTKHINSDFGKEGYLNAAGRLHLDFGSTDTAVYFLSQGSRAGRYGFDIAHDITSDLEVYGEWARVSAQDFRLATPTGASVTRTEAAVSYLAGLRYRTRERLSYLLELHRNGAGYTEQEFQDFVTLADNAALAGAGSALMDRATRLADTSFGRQKPMRQYLYVRASQDTLPFTPSIRATVNLQDGSYSITPELLYLDRNRWGLRARLSLYGGGSGTEYGERYYSSRFELRFHYHF